MFRFLDKQQEACVGRFERNAREQFTEFTPLVGLSQVSSTATTLDYSTRSSKSRLSRAITDLAIGLKWARCFNWCNKNYPVSLTLMWEHHGFHNMTDFNFISRGFNLTPSDLTQVETSPVAIGARKPVGDLYTHGLHFH